MYIVRSGGHWDNPKIEFVTEDEEIAKALRDLDRHKRFDDYVKSRQWTLDHIKERMDLKEFRISKGTYNKDIDGYDEHFESFDDQLVRAEKETKIIYEEYLTSEVGRGRGDWYYEEAPLINNLEEATKRFR